MSSGERSGGDWTRVVMPVAGALSVLLGLMNLFAWYTQNAVLLQIRPDRQWIAMVYNTGLTFLFCGGGLLVVTFGRPRLAAACAVVPLVLGMLSMTEHAADVDLGIDQLLMSHDNPIGRVGTLHPGRQAPQTGLCEVLTAAALLLMSRPAAMKYRPLTGGVLGSLLVGLGVVGAFGYLVGVKTYDWGRYLPIAVHTATGFAILGVGVLAFSWRDGARRGEGAPRWLPIPVGLAVVAATLCLWQALIAEISFSVPTVTLVVGFGLAGLLALMVSLTQTAFRNVRAVREAVARLSAASAEILASTTDQAQGTAAQAAAVTQTMAAVAQLAQTAEQTTQQARGVGGSVQHTLEIGQAGRLAVEEAVRSMAAVRDQVESTAETIVGLAEQAQAIGQIIAAVTEIAEQTNLLSLNAAIEAARAGEHGKGFAVVAAEVKALADESKKATGQVLRILGEIQKASNQAVLSTEQGMHTTAAASRVVGQAGETIRALADTLAETAQAAAQIEASARQQALGMGQISQAMQDVERVSRGNVVSVGQIEQTARRLHTFSRVLTALAGRAPEDGQGAGERPA